MSFGEYLKYQNECYVSSHPNARFVFLLVHVILLLFVLAAIWDGVADSGGDGDDENLSDDRNRIRGINDAIFMVFLVLTTGDFRGDIGGKGNAAGERFVYVLMIVTGLVVIAVLIGFVTDTVTRAFQKIVAGRTRVVEDKHTLILGWNDSTVRFVTQVSQPSGPASGISAVVYNMFSNSKS